MELILTLQQVGSEMNNHVANEYSTQSAIDTDQTTTSHMSTTDPGVNTSGVSDNEFIDVVNT